MAYTPTYESGDLSAIFIDIIGSGAVEVVSFIALIVILVLLVWVVKKMKKLK